MSTGVVTCGKLVVTEDSMTFDQLTDVDASAPTHDDVIIYKDNLIDPLYTTGWHSAGFLIENFTNVNSATTPLHNEILTYNDNLIDGAYADGWVNKDISAVFTGLTTTIEGIVSATDAVVQAKDGNSGLNDMVMFTDSIAGAGVVNVSIGSAFDNNALFKKELTDTDFIFVQTLSQGEILDTTYTAGTVFKSTKGIYGFSGPVPTPLGLPSMGFKLTKFNSSVASTTIVLASLGTDVEVTLFESDGTTVADGPVTISANQLATLTCNGLGEFVVSSSGTVIGYVNANGTQKRLLVPMTTEILTHTNNTLVSSLSGSANVTWYRRNGNTGTDIITSGTASALTSGTTGTEWANGGWMILRSDIPICSYTTGDTAGNQSIPGWPLDKLAQVFPNPSFLDLSVTHELASICITSPYAGSATVYDSTGAVFGTFNYNRTTNPAVTVDDQKYPAGGRWMPSDEGAVTLSGGYIVCNTPCLCIMNFNGSTVWTGQTGDEIVIAGTTPEDIRAEIRIDADGFARRRDMDNAGLITWEVC